MTKFGKNFIDEMKKQVGEQLKVGETQSDQIQVAEAQPVR